MLERTAAATGPTQVLKAAAFYVSLTFAAGLTLGPLRELVVAPRFGRVAGLALEAPVMAAVSFAAAAWAVHRTALPSGTGVRLAVGLVGLALLLAAEDALSRVLRGASLPAVWAGYEPAANALNLALLAVFAAAPLLVGRQASPARIPGP